MHATQQIVSDDETGLVVTLQLIPNYELMQLLLSFGPEVKVLGPDGLRDKVREMIERSRELYTV